MRIVGVDSDIFSDVSKESKIALSTFCAENNLVLSVISLRAKSIQHQHDTVSISSLVICVLSLLVNVLQLQKRQEVIWTPKKLIDECDAYLKLHNISHVSMVYKGGFENLTLKNGKPCIVEVLTDSGKLVALHVGINEDMIVFSPGPYNPRSL